MTAIDVLRRLLDERGVDYRVSATGYSIDIGPYITAYANRSDTTLDVSLRQVTPEQAIAATLGAGTCKLTRASWDDGTCTWGCICSACDAHLEHETGIGYNYCPMCGRRIEQ